MTFHDFSLAPHQNIDISANNLEYKTQLHFRWVVFWCGSFTHAHLLPIQSSRYSILSIYHYSRLAFCLFCALPPLVKISLRAHLFVTVALFINYLGQSQAWSWGKILNRMFESTNYTHENTGAGTNFWSTKDKCESIPKPRYLSWIVTYEDDQTIIFHCNFT